jgi:hypothetical protein
MLGMDLGVGGVGPSSAQKARTFADTEREGAGVSTRQK